MVVMFDEREAKILRDHRTHFNTKKPVAANTPEKGHFYLCRLEPDALPDRAKFGFSVNPNDRLTDYRCANPYATMIHTWPCHRLWEQAALACVAACPEAKHIAGEVYDVPAVAVIERLDRFFELTGEP